MDAEERITQLEQALEEAKIKQDNDIAQVYEHLQYMRYDAKIKALENKIRELENRRDQKN